MSTVSRDWLASFCEEKMAHFIQRKYPTDSIEPGQEQHSPFESEAEKLVSVPALDGISRTNSHSRTDDGITVTFWERAYRRLEYTSRGNHLFDVAKIARYFLMRHLYFDASKQGMREKRRLSGNTEEDTGDALKRSKTDANKLSSLEEVFLTFV